MNEVRSFRVEEIINEVLQKGYSHKDVAVLTRSNDNASFIASYLVSKGIKAERINAKGYGETKPLGTNDTEEGKQLNRRVEFTILKN